MLRCVFGRKGQVYSWIDASKDRVVCIGKSLLISEFARPSSSLVCVFIHICVYVLMTSYL